jgi:hypothetical protein
MCWTLRINHCWFVLFILFGQQMCFATHFYAFLYLQVFCPNGILYGSWKPCVCIFSIWSPLCFACLLWSNIWLTPSNPKWLRCAWYTNLTNKYAHIYVEFVLYIVVSLTTLDPISLGTKMYLNLVLGTLEMQWMLVSFIRKVLLPYNIWSQARVNDKHLSTTS